MVVGCADDEADVATTTPTIAPDGMTGDMSHDMNGDTSSDTSSDTTLGPYVSPLGDVIGEALVAGQFTTLAGLLVEADLVQALRADGPFTVFAPTDSAFTALPVSTLDAVYADPELLATVLTHHVVAGTYHVADLEDGQRLETLAGDELVVSIDGDTVSVDGVEVVAADVPATNGLIHVVGAVLVPGS